MKSPIERLTDVELRALHKLTYHALEFHKPFRNGYGPSMNAAERAFMKLVQEIRHRAKR